MPIFFVLYIVLFGEWQQMIKTKTEMTNFYFCVVCAKNVRQE